MKEATSLKEGGVTVASRVVVPVYCKRLQIKRTHPGPSARQLGIRFWAGFLRPLADHTVTTLGANGFGTDKLMAANWACIWNIKDLVGIHFRTDSGFF